MYKPFKKKKKREKSKKEVSFWAFPNLKSKFPKFTQKNKLLFYLNY